MPEKPPPKVIRAGVSATRNGWIAPKPKPRT